MLFAERASDDLAEEQRVVFPVDVHVLGDGGIELACVHFGGIDDLAFQLYRALLDSHRVDQLRGDGVETEFLELIELAAGHIGAAEQLRGHVRGRNIHDEALVFGDEVVRIFLFANGKHENVAVPHAAERAPLRVHYVYFVAAAAADEHSAHLDGVHYYISLSVSHKFSPYPKLS